MTRVSLTSSENTLVEGVDDNATEMLSTVEHWSAQNSGSYNRAGLRAMRALLSDRFSNLPGEITEVSLPDGQHVTAHGEVENITYEPALKVTVRPDAPVQLVLTGHYDTVFPENFHFQQPVRIDDDTINGPGTADMKAGLMVMLTALETFERSDNAANIGYTIIMSPDEEIGSPGSSAILEELGKRSHVGMTYEPCLLYTSPSPRDATLSRMPSSA